MTEGLRKVPPSKLDLPLICSNGFASKDLDCNNGGPHRTASLQNCVVIIIVLMDALLNSSKPVGVAK